jgi:hypothetical protein
MLAAVCGRGTKTASPMSATRPKAELPEGWRQERFGGRPQPGLDLERDKARPHGRRVPAAGPIGEHAGKLGRLVDVTIPDPVVAPLPGLGHLVLTRHEVGQYVRIRELVESEALAKDCGRFLR